MGVHYVSDELRDCSRNKKTVYSQKFVSYEKPTFPNCLLTVFFTVSRGLKTLELLVINSFSLIFHNLL